MGKFTSVRWLNPEFYQPYFNVSTADIIERVKLSIKPIGGSSDFLSTVKDNPDLYGPFWILTTWTVLLSICVIIWDYLNVTIIVSFVI